MTLTLNLFATERVYQRLEEAQIGYLENKYKKYLLKCIAWIDVADRFKILPIIYAEKYLVQSEL